MKRRKTVAKEEILNILKESNEAFSQDCIQKKIKTSVDRATVYRILKSYCEQGLAHKIIADDGKQYFAYCNTCKITGNNYNHFHFRCEDCGKLECIEIEVTIKVPEGYSSNKFNGVITGSCNKC